MTVQVTRTAAIALFTELGITTANKWNAKRMGAKLQKIDEMVDDDTDIEDEEIDATLTTLLEAIEAEEDIEVVAGEKAPAKPAKEAPKGKKAAKPKEAEEEDGDGDDGEEEETVPVQTAAQKKKAAAAAKKAKAAEEKKAAAAAKKKAAEEKKAAAIPGVRETRTRPFLAGVVIANHGGLKAGVTEEMVQELDELYGKENPSESMFTLRNAWHAIRGFQNGDSEEE